MYVLFMIGYASGRCLVTERYRYLSALLKGNSSFDYSQRMVSYVILDGQVRRMLFFSRVKPNEIFQEISS